MARNEHVTARLAIAHFPPKTIALLCAISLTSAFFLAPASAAAEDIDTNPTPDEFQQKIEQTAADLEEANAKVAEANEAIRSHRAEITKLESQIPAQQARSDAAARELYKMEQEAPGILDLLLNSENFFDFLNNLDYFNRISESHIAEINRLNEMKRELDDSTAALEQAKKDAEDRAAEADKALTEAKEARLEAQRKAQEAARQKAEAATAAAGGSANAGSNAGSAAQDDAAGHEEPQEEAAAITPAEEAAVVDDGADWSDDESAFIASWAPRIDAYLSGSPLSGQGATFAAAAWEYGVDPRWSPAISCVESTKGAYCFLPHNAWGWGSVSWDSWEEAIYGHVRGLARGYGYTVSYEAAAKYCPPNADFWYRRCLEEMAKI